jgi:AbrB family looped-hinge helix DNA binding protein
MIPVNIRVFSQSMRASSFVGLQKISNAVKWTNMQATVTINSRGVVTLPAKLRQAMGLKADDQLIAETTAEGILLRPAVTMPLEVYTAERLREFEEAEAELAAVLKKRKR